MVGIIINVVVSIRNSIISYNIIYTEPQTRTKNDATRRGPESWWVFVGWGVPNNV